MSQKLNNWHQPLLKWSSISTNEFFYSNKWNTWFFVNFNIFVISVYLYFLQASDEIDLPSKQSILSKDVDNGGPTTSAGNSLEFFKLWITILWRESSLICKKLDIF